MNKIFAIILLTLLLTQNTKAQKRRMVSMRVAKNQIELGFQHNILSDKLWADFYTGIGNQDINSSFDDFTIGLGIGFNAFSNKKNRIAINTGIGLYIPNNNYYSATVLILNPGVRYSRFFGKEDKHCFLVSSGYRHGRRDYRQEYSSDRANVSTIGTFKISPLYFSIGYGFRF